MWWDALIPIIGNVFNRVLPDPKAAEDAKMKLAEMAQQGQLAELDADLKVALGQMDINKAEASNASIFVAGARPFIIWGCGVSMLYAALFEPLMRFIAVVVFHYTGSFPVLDTSVTTQILFALLGLGGYRTAEKIKGVARNKL